MKSKLIVFGMIVVILIGMWLFTSYIDSARVSRVAAVLEKRLGLRFSDQDIYINVAGGIKIKDSAVDAALAAALYSARTAELAATA